MSELKSRLTEDMKSAMKAGEKERLGAIRMILASIKQKEVDERITLTDAHILAILDKSLKEHRDSLSQFQSANRHDLVEKEQFEISIIQHYLPTQLSETEITDLVKKVMTETGATSVKDMGKVMAALKPLIQGRADPAEVSNKVKEYFK